MSGIYFIRNNFGLIFSEKFCKFVFWKFARFIIFTLVADIGTTFNGEWQKCGSIIFPSTGFNHTFQNILKLLPALPELTAAKQQPVLHPTLH